MPYNTIVSLSSILLSSIPIFRLFYMFYSSAFILTKASCNDFYYFLSSATILQQLLTVNISSSSYLLRCRCLPLFSSLEYHSVRILLRVLVYLCEKPEPGQLYRSGSSMCFITVHIFFQACSFSQHFSCDLA